MYPKCDIGVVVRPFTRSLAVHVAIDIAVAHVSRLSTAKWKQGAQSMTARDLPFSNQSEPIIRPQHIGNLATMEDCNDISYRCARWHVRQQF